MLTIQLNKYHNNTYRIHAYLGHEAYTTKSETICLHDTDSIYEAERIINNLLKLYGAEMTVISENDYTDIPF